MSNVIRRVPPHEYRESVNDPDFPVAEWLHNPELANVAGVARRYWKVFANTVVEMTAAEKAAVDAAEVQAVKNAQLSEAQAGILKALLAEIIAECNFLRSQLLPPQSPRTAQEWRDSIRGRL